MKGHWSADTVCERAVNVPHTKKPSQVALKIQSDPSILFDFSKEFMNHFIAISNSIVVNVKHQNENGTWVRTRLVFSKFQRHWLETNLFPFRRDTINRKIHQEKYAEL